MAARRTVLGLNTAHDAAACLMVDGVMAVAVAEERLTRVKHHEGFPHRALEYCLEAAGIASLDAVDAIVINEYTHTDFGLDLRHAGFRGQIFTNPSHHLLHAYYAWIASGFDDPAVLVTDGSGYAYGEYERRESPLLGPPPPYSEMEEAESLYEVEQGELRLVHKNWGLWTASRPFYRFPSLGHMFSAASQYIFGQWTHAGKTMGLAPYGDAGRFPDPIIEYGPAGMRIDTEWITRLPPRTSDPAHFDQTCRDIAAKVQVEVEQAILYLCNRLHEETGRSRLCLTGGVGLNSVANGRILRETPFTELYITPAAGDSGVAIGAALYGDRMLAGQVPRWHANHTFHGRSYGDDEVEAALEAGAGLIRGERLDDPAAAAARDVVDGKVIGWFEGASEFGPRALGHRSIVCDPRLPEMRDRLNESVKFREPFRPYAASVLVEHAADYFALLGDDPFMMTVTDIHEAERATIPSVCHVDDTCRIQTVDEDYPGRYRRLIERVFAETGVPMVLNTSFNIRGEPIVETPEDALGCFLGCNMDVLYVEEWRIEKVTADSADDPEALVPVLNAGVSFGSVTDSADGGALAPRFYSRARTGHEASISRLEYRVGQRVNGISTVAEIGEGLPGTAPGEVASTVARLQRNGLLALRFPEGERVEQGSHAASAGSST
jgi:carbamoyltransferase